METNLKIRRSLPKAAGAALIVSALMLSACGGKEPGPAAKAFNAKQQDLARRREQSLRTRIVKPVRAPNGGYQAMPATISSKGVIVPDEHAGATAKENGTASATVPPDSYASAPRIKPPATFPMLETGAPGGTPLTTPGPDAKPTDGPVAPGTPGVVRRPSPRQAAETAQAIAAAEAHRKAVQGRQAEALKQQTARRTAAIKDRDIARNKRFRLSKPTDIAPAKGSITSDPRPVAAKPKTGAPQAKAKPTGQVAPRTTPKGG